MKNWTDYLDANGLVVQNNGDGGDSLNRTAVVGILNELGNNDDNFRDMHNAVAHCLSSHDLGKYRRSNHPGMWYSNFDRTSRDQLIPITILYGLLEDRELLGKMFVNHLGRGLLFAYNTKKNFVYPTLEEHLAKSTPDVPWNYKWKMPDLTGPDFWALYVRGFNKWYTYPALFFLDIESLVGSIILRYFSPDKDDVINHALMLEYSKVRMDTWLMRLARKITPRSFLQERLDKFFGVDQEPPINELYRELK